MRPPQHFFQLLLKFDTHSETFLRSLSFQISDVLSHSKTVQLVGIQHFVFNSLPSAFLRRFTFRTWRIKYFMLFAYNQVVVPFWFQYLDKIIKSRSDARFAIFFLLLLLFTWLLRGLLDITWSESPHYSALLRFLTFDRFHFRSCCNCIPWNIWLISFRIIITIEWATLIFLRFWDSLVFMELICVFFHWNINFKSSWSDKLL